VLARGSPRKVRTRGTARVRSLSLKFPARVLDQTLDRQALTCSLSPESRPAPGVTTAVRRVAIPSPSGDFSITSWISDITLKKEVVILML
jgi:hypothetical protein